MFTTFLTSVVLFYVLAQVGGDCRDDLDDCPYYRRDQ